MRNRLASDQAPVLEEPRVVGVELLIAVVGENRALDLLRDAQDESVTATHRAGRRRDQFVVVDRLVEFGHFLLVDPVSERGVDDDRDQVLGVLGHERRHGIAELLEARLRPAFGGDVRTVDDHVASHGLSSQPSRGCWPPVPSTIEP